MNCEQRYGGRCRGEAEVRGQQQGPGHSREGPTPTATGRSSGRTMEIAVKRFILAVVRSHGESHARGLTAASPDATSKNEQGIINAAAIKYYDNAADTERRFPPRPARTAPSLPAS